MIPRIGLVGMAGPLEVGFSETPSILLRMKNQLEKIAPVLTNLNILYDLQTVQNAANFFANHDFDLLCVGVGTWSEDHYLLDFLEYYNKPVVLWALPAVESGSLCGVQQICCVLKELDKPYFYVYGEPEDIKVHQKIHEISMAVALLNYLRRSRIGVIGGRVKGMTEIAYDELEIKAKTGVRIVNLDDDELTESVINADRLSASELWNIVRQKVGMITVDNQTGIDALCYYLGLKKLINQYGLEGICIKCYPRYMGKVCLAYSLLAEEGIVGGCEGDVNNTVAMKILFNLTGKPVHNTDLLYPDPGSQTILFSHCGSGGFSVANEPTQIQLSPVRLLNQGVCALFPAKTGIVTLVNLVGRRGTFRMSAITGEAIECGMEFPGNPLKVRFNRSLEDLNEEIASKGIGHHWMAGYGDVRKELEYFCSLNKIQYYSL
ncbi:MAG: hypothetical protein KBG67_01340 [Candidatus Atribacteria bacterium]|nr:hypothetical protein [Candidatus Atribacteria bacterium]